MFHYLTLILLHPRIRPYSGWLLQWLIYWESWRLWRAGSPFATFADTRFYAGKVAYEPAKGERTVEYPWAHAHLVDLHHAVVIDVGAQQGLPTTDLLLAQGNRVYGIDPTVAEPRQLPGFVLMPGDIRATGFPDEAFDAVVVVSTLEHVGVAGRYGLTDSDPDGDLRAMAEIHRILRPGGRCLITVPVGCGRSLPLNRLYDPVRLARLVERFQVRERTYYRYYDQYGLWLQVDEASAAAVDWDVERWYALACLDVRKEERGAMAWKS